MKIGAGKIWAALLAALLMAPTSAAQIIRPTPVPQDPAPLGAVIQDITVNCGGGSVSPAPPGPHYDSCGLHLINQNPSDRVVVFLRRRIPNGDTMVMWDSQLQQTQLTGQEGEVLLSPGQAAPLLTCILYEQRPLGEAPGVDFEYEVSGPLTPRPDDIDDHPRADPRDYFRIIEQLDTTAPGPCQDARVLVLVNLHFTRRMAASIRNTAPRYGGPNAPWRSVFISPSRGSSDTRPGCAADLAQNYIEIRDVRFAD